MFNFYLEDSIPSWTDIVQSLAAVIGVAFLIINFRKQNFLIEEQARMNSQQTRLFELAMEKNRLEMMPRLRIKSKEEITDDSWRLVLELSNADAYTMEIVTSNTGNFVYTSSYLLRPEMAVKDEIDIWVAEKNDLVPSNFLSTVRIKFLDITGREYLQTLTDEGLSMPRELK